MTAVDDHAVAGPRDGGATVAVSRSSSAGWRQWAALVTVLLAVVGVAALVVGHRDRRPVDLAVLDAPATSLHQLVDRADLVVVGRIVEVSPGRVLSDPDDPDRAVRTQFAQLEVDEVTVGPARTRVVLEEVAALADGTPATVEGVGASAVGDAGLYLLAVGDGGRVGPVGPQGRYLLDPDDPDRLLVSGADDPLASRLAALGPRRLRRAVLDAARSR